MTKLQFLHVNNTNIVDEDNRPVHLKGVALGGWLMMEGYMMCGRNIPEKAFKDGFERSLGREALEDFTRSFRDIFIREYDIKLIKEWGANCVRVPFNYRLVEFENKPFSLNEGGLGYLDRIVDWCEKHSLYCILDLHAAPGAQNPDWHADCVGKPEFFSEPFNQERYLRLWHFLADRYKDSRAVAGYDILNEPVVPMPQEGAVRELYKKVTKEIRDADQKHIIFIEGTDWSARLAPFANMPDKNTAYSVHGYAPADYVFNWIIELYYPGRIYKIMWNKKTLETLAKQYCKFIKMNSAPMYIGEFGVNWRGGHFGELDWVKDVLYIFEKNHFHWTYWTYKTVANSVFPDGIYRYVDNPPWINRKGPVTGWENFYTMWTKEKGRIISSWRTENFARNDRLYSVLKNHF